MAAASILRFALLAALWIVLAGHGWTDLPVGLVAAALATWTSLSLLPPSQLRLRPHSCMVLLLRFPWAALRAGLQVARLALDPRVSPTPSEVIYVPRLPPGRARDAFLAYASLLPGTLPAGPDASGGIVVHALNGTPRVLESFAEEEARFARAFRLDD